jgi:purine-binding chemotaxis protein CheW
VSPLSPQKPDDKRREAEPVQLVAFRVGDGLYAVDILRIKEIVNPPKITAVPKAPQFIEGVIELRGAILPVVDLRKRFDLPATPVTRTSKIIIVGIDVGGRRMIVGLIVDSVLEPLRVQQDQIRPAPALATGEAAYFSGVVNRRRAEREVQQGTGREERRRNAESSEEGIFMLLDLDAILSSKEKITLAGLDGPPPKDGGAAGPVSGDKA